MKLKKMDITGFKSFCDRASIAFPAGISAIVGPNGCGKSNIVDALRWAMGEQSVKQLRGKSMEDVIFAGTNGRAPLNMAEVSLTLVNDNGTAPEELKDFTEIMLTRRLYRSGERSYFINKQPCRLKDIHNIFLGSGMGAKSYAVIQQGNIGAITDAGPEERRFFIEEAAGISRYKNRKKETLSKLEATNQNLLRVTDIISEVERQMNSLKRQALKAERFQKYQERKKHLDIRLAIHHYDQYSQEIQKNTYLLKELKDEDLAHATSLKKLDAAIEEIRLRRTRKNQEIADQRSGQFEIQRNIDRSENDLDHLKKEMNQLTTESKELQTAHITLQERNREILAEVADGESRNVGLRQETETVKALLTREQADSQGIRGKLADLNQALERAKSELTERVGQEARYKNIFQNVSSNKDNLRRRLKRADEDVVLAGQKVTECEKKEAEAQEEVRLCRDETEEIGEQIDAIRAGLGEKSKALGQQVKAVQTLEYDRNKVRSRYAALKKMADSFEWYRDGVKAVMKSEAMQDRISGVMADILEPEPGYAAAVEAVLGEALQYVIVSDRAAGQEAIGFLRSRNAGRGGFIPATGVRVPAHGQAANPDRLLAHVRVKPGFEEIAEALLGHAVVADSLADCAPEHGTVRVTRDGEVLTPQGVMVGGSPEKLSGILLKKQELRTLENQLAETGAVLERARAEQKATEDQVRVLENDLQKKTEQKNAVVQDEIEAQKAVYRTTEELKSARRNLEILGLEQEQLLGEAEDAEEEMEKYNAALGRIGEEVREAQERVARLSGEIEQVSGEMAGFEERVMDIRLRLTAINAELESNTGSLRRLKSFQEDGASRLEQLSADIERKGLRLIEIRDRASEHETGLARMYEEMRETEAELAGTEADYQAIDTDLTEKDTAVSEIQRRRETVLQKIRMVEVEQSQRQMRRENVENRTDERYHRPLAAFRPELPRMAGADLPPEKLPEALAQLDKKIKSIGNVNLEAIAEYEALKERFGFLETQRNDLVKAVEDLHKVIRKINRISQERFMKTFEQVNEKMGEVFPRLFQGGTARLILTEPDKPLDSGVEFMVHPPGKKLTRLTLLSGGEKALSAIAFVFSIFLIKPASFCILDEIDAPLDEANVFRFNELLKIIGEKSQIIMITHKRKSMEFADTLFGITMEQQGVSKVVSVNFETVQDDRTVAD